MKEMKRPDFHCNPWRIPVGKHVAREYMDYCIERDKEDAQIGRSYASAKNRACYIGTVTHRFKEHFRVTTREGGKISIRYGNVSKDSWDFDFDEWDEILASQREDERPEIIK